MNWELQGKWYKRRVSKDESRQDVFKQLSRVLSEQVIPLHAGIDWDHLAVEVWPLSGKVNVFPAVRIRDKHVYKRGCLMLFESLETQAYSFDDELLGDRQYATEIQRLISAWIEDLPECLADANRGVLLKFYNCDSKKAFLETNV